MPVYLLFDVGSTYTKGCIVDTDHESVLGSADAPSTPATDIAEGIEAVKAQLKPILDQVRIDQTLMCSSAKGGLRMVAVGLVPDLTLKAATLACNNAGAKVIGAYAFTLTQSECREIEALNPDILLLCGGTDGGNQENILSNAKQLCRLKSRFPILYAGNKSARDATVELLVSAGFEVQPADNVMPAYGELDVEDARSKIRELFLKSIIKAKGLSQLKNLIDDIILPTPLSVLEALRLLAYGTPLEPGWGDLMAIDIGGATTDVYSLNAHLIVADNVSLHGLREPLAKRSVEGDLGVRVNAPNVYAFLKAAEGPDPGLEAYLARLADDPQSPAIPAYDTQLATWCARLASQRHAGRLEKSYTPMGVSYQQTGKDLRGVHTLIGIGGPILHSDHPETILDGIAADPASPEILLPEEFERYLDRNYVLSCLGLLASRHPEAVLRILKKNLEKPEHAPR